MTEHSRPLAAVLHPDKKLPAYRVILSHPVCGQLVFSDFLWTMRSIYLPLFITFQMELPKADLYHCVATGYAGVLGSMAKHIYGSRLLVSEHGIYTREREEELIKAKWVNGIYKNIWIAKNV